MEVEINQRELGKPVVAKSDTSQLVAFYIRRPEDKSYDLLILEKEQLLVRAKLLHEPDAIAFAGDQVVALHPEGFDVYDKSGMARSVAFARGQPKSMAADKEHIAIALNDDSVVIYGSQTLEKVFEIGHDKLKRPQMDSGSDKTPLFQLKNGSLYVIFNRAFYVVDLSTKNMKEFQLEATPTQVALEGNALALAISTRIRLWDLEAGRELPGSLIAEDVVTSLALHEQEDGLLELFAGLRRGKIQIWSPWLELAARQKEGTAGAEKKETEVSPVPQTGYLSRIGNAFRNLFGRC